MHVLLISLLTRLDTGSPTGLEHMIQIHQTNTRSASPRSTRRFIPPTHSSRPIVGPSVPMLLEHFGGRHFEVLQRLTSLVLGILDDA